MNKGKVIRFPGATTIETSVQQAMAEFLEYITDKQVSTVLIIAEDVESNMIFYSNRIGRDRLVALAERIKQQLIKGYDDE